MTMTQTAPATSAGTGWHIGLWAAQIVLAGLFGMAAYMKLFMSADALVQMGLLWVDGAPMWFVRAIGLAELAAVLGLILPAATRIMPQLTVLAALGCTALQVLAIGFHMFRGEFSVLPFNAIYLGLALLVLWGRSRKSPIAPRA